MAERHRASGPQRKGRRARGARRPAVSREAGVQRHDVLGLRALLALADGELHSLAFGQGAEPGALDGAEVHEDVGAVFALDETEALGFVEKLDGTCDGIGHVM